MGKACGCTKGIIQLGSEGFLMVMLAITAMVINCTDHVLKMG